MRSPAGAPRSVEEVRDDFDRLALLTADAWSHNDHHHPWLLRQLPTRLGVVLEVGCGAGAFSRELAARAERVLALDLSPEMLRIARARSAHLPNLVFEQADAATRALPEARFDAIVSIATLHHLPLDETIEGWKRALRPGGTLLILDLVSGGLALDLAAVPAALGVRLWRTGRLRDPAPVRAAWD